MGKFILFCSGKGGVGKSTLVYNIGLELSREMKVLMIDCDVGLKNLDLISKVKDVLNYDLFDVYNGSVSFEKALVHVGPSLDLLSLYGPTTLSYLKDDLLVNFAKKLRDDYDLILLDAPAGIEKGFELTRKIADQFVIVINPTLPSYKDAYKVSEILRRDNESNIVLLLNRFTSRDMPFFKSRANFLCNYEVIGVVNELSNSLFSKFSFKRNVKKVALKLKGSHEKDGVFI